jgi:short-subunit dehydrogenase
MAPTYAGAKAGIAMFAEALGLRLKGSGVSVTLVSAGFIDTPMSRQVTTPKPFLLSAEKAAAIIARRIARKPRRIAVPWQFGVIRVLALTLPRALTRSVLNRF